MTYLEIYERALWDLEHNNITLGEFEERVIPLNQEPTSVIEELEKIKEEIDETKKEFIENDYDYAGCEAYLNECNVFKIIDNHIKELKGENNE